MEIWASRYGKQAQFLMVCVESAGVAIQFGRMFGLKNVINCFIPSREYMPVGFGQLGCSGFIISDTQGCFVSRKTKAFLQYGKDAFSHVEDLLRKFFAIHNDTGNKMNAQEEDVLHPNWSLPSVGITTMDHEHRMCEEALSNLLCTPNVASLKKAMSVLGEHFQHEEILMKRSGFGSPGKAFSPYANHVKDHERILDIGYSQLAELSNKKESNRPVSALTSPEAQFREPRNSPLSMTCSKMQESGSAS